MADEKRSCHNCGNADVGARDGCLLKKDDWQTCLDNKSRPFWRPKCEAVAQCTEKPGQKPATMEDCLAKKEFNRDQEGMPCDFCSHHINDEPVYCVSCDPENSNYEPYEFSVENPMRGEGLFEEIDTDRAKEVLVTGEMEKARAFTNQKAMPEKPEQHFEEKMKQWADEAVNHPRHYTRYPVEVIDIIREVLREADGIGISAFQAYCLGNEVKYRMRAGLKGDGAEDIQKAMKYMEFREADK